MCISECSRCHKLIELSPPGDMTAGYYEVSLGDWARFAKPDEWYLCDTCMWKTPLYVALYGVTPPGKVEATNG